MIEQLKTLREFVEAYSPSRNPSGAEALTALTQLEAMVGTQEPVAWRAVLDPEQAPQQLKTTMHVVGFREKKAAEGFASEQIDFYGWRYTIEPLYAAPVAQQPTFDARRALEAIEALLSNIRRDAPSLSGKVMGFAEEVAAALRDKVARQPQARPDFTDEWTGYLKDGETPFERFLRERKDVQSVLKLYQRALEENESLKAQQPQAEKRCQYCDGTGDVHSIDGQWRGECHCQKQPQAEAVPLTHVLVPVDEPTDEMVDAACAAVDGLCRVDFVRAYVAAFAHLKAGYRDESYWCGWNAAIKFQQAEAVPAVDRVYEAAKRLVDHADFQLGGVLSAKSKTRDIPSNAASKVKARHLASLRDALAKTPQQTEAVPPGFVAFARDVLADFPHGFPDEFDLNDLAIKHGLLIGKTVTERCGEFCNCAEYHGDDELKGGVTCYHRHAAIAQQKGGV